MICTLFKTIFTYIFFGCWFFWATPVFFYISGKGITWSSVEPFIAVFLLWSTDSPRKVWTGVVVILGLHSTGSEVVGAHGLSCSSACGSSEPGTQDPCHAALAGDFYH